MFGTGSLKSHVVEEAAAVVPFGRTLSTTLVKAQKARKSLFFKFHVATVALAICWGYTDRMFIRSSLQPLTYQSHTECSKFPAIMISSNGQFGSAGSEFRFTPITSNPVIDRLLVDRHVTFLSSSHLHRLRSPHPPASPVPANATERLKYQTLEFSRPSSFRVWILKPTSRPSLKTASAPRPQAIDSSRRTLKSSISSLSANYFQTYPSFSSSCLSVADDDAVGVFLDSALWCCVLERLLTNPGETSHPGHSKPSHVSSTLMVDHVLQALAHISEFQKPLTRNSNESVEVASLQCPVLPQSPTGNSGKQQHGIQDSPQTGQNGFNPDLTEMNSGYIASNATWPVADATYLGPQGPTHSMPLGMMETLQLA
ncbi:hypothetical protein DFH06DRAFT_1308022 [Mycena polygramma]|nr:hypothetical protein DFH06DRAFT_1308022 [Mycena polygramma]